VSSDSKIERFVCKESSLTRNDFLKLLRYIYTGRREDWASVAQSISSLRLDWETSDDNSFSEAYDSIIIKSSKFNIVRADNNPMRPRFP
jgi:hypothetical protein